MLLRTLSLLALVAVSGCAAQQDRAVPAARIHFGRWLKPTAGTGLLTVKGDVRPMHGPCADRLAVDGVEVATLRSGEKIELYLPWGDHLLTTRAAALRPDESAPMCMGALADALVGVAPGAPASYRVSHDQDGDTHIRPDTF
jgi:hypothetical protein